MEVRWSTILDEDYQTACFQDTCKYDCSKLTAFQCQTKYLTNCAAITAKGSQSTYNWHYFTYKEIFSYTIFVPWICVLYDKHIGLNTLVHHSGADISPLHPCMSSFFPDSQGFVLETFQAGAYAKYTEVNGMQWSKMVLCRIIYTCRVRWRTCPPRKFHFS